ncbi:MAG: hypothetical protein ACNYZG_05290 [Gammaproteobacteria bacterium]
MSDYLLIHLHDAFKKLQESLAEANRVIAAGDLPIWLPEPFEQDRKLAADAITECWYQDEKIFPPTGLICVSPEHSKIFSEANTCKENFKDEIMIFKNASTKKRTNLVSMIESVGKTGGRNAKVAEAMQVLRISRLNLLWCYRQILVLPKNLNSVSWTWSTSSKSIDKISYTDALQLVGNEIADENTQNLIIGILRAYQSRQLVRVKKVAPHLRANITFDKDGVRTRKMVTTPTVIISQDATLPRIRWPDKDVKNTRLGRIDIKLNPEPIVKALGIYTYLD